MVTRLSAMTILIASFLLLLIFLLNYFNFVRTHEEITNDRFRIVLNDMKSTIETGLNLGVNLRELTNVQTLVESAVAKHKDIQRIDLVGESGNILFSSDRQRVGKAAENEITEDMFRRIVTRVENSFGKRAAELRLIYPQSVLDVKNDAVLTQMLKDFSLILLIASAAIILAIKLVTHRLRHTLADLDAALGQWEARRGDAHSFRHAAKSPLGAACAQFASTIDKAESLLDRDGKA